MSTKGTIVRHDQFFIDGGWVVPAGASRIEVVSPNTGEIIGDVPEAGTADIDTAVAAARRAFDDPQGWSQWTPRQRADAIERLADEIDARKDEIARLVSSQNGMPISTSLGLEAVFPSAVYRYYAGLVRDQPVEEERPGLLGGTTLVRRIPIGVVGAIVPWNYPQTLASFKIAPALASGCTIVVKPSPETVLDDYVFAQAVEAAQLPPGVINIVPGGREAGRALVEHPGIDKIAFTGSTAAGREIAATCGRLLRPVTLELGGKSAAVLLDDVDLAASMQGLYGATLLNNGQTCFAGTRILAPRSRYDEVVEAFAGLLQSLPIGDSLDEATLVGPMATSAQRDRVESFIARGRSEGGRVAVGGGRPQELGRGWFVEPTLLTGLDNSATVSQDEIFGPVLVVIPYDDIEHAVRIANDSPYGLGGSVWTADHGRGVDVARRIHTGTIGVNGYLPDPTAPFGGVKASGIGRELGPEGLASYQTAQSIYL
ncbi:MAG: aldehyde dehydrogenase [Microbacterium ginsengisoli]|jgi:acyl-CoA reductase-like NAD-dependent aldehyde dehydrogenase|uniref:aldehyde dehydrogenase n=1 Tax=Microbacterium TaxID=33882 RepID=UPI0006F2A27D|nr:MULTISPECIES: aldehyde dehydrogenase [Microbacterium]MBN9197181.1 aldehyde dehydrogenase [Microbacterium ginsengisoli]KQR91158.1 aldehyde dehydrogenase [Microbacterium sp. Leaf347]KQS01168.1 aldehyde dehydrogenase [Microbacterium sp. Leaf351]KXC07187.1 aldehyde dehydrogenase [Microbacterium hominis]MBN9208631.1 aldehyde dehydrogenase [Microbacterium ginsengisoli]